MSVVLEEKPFTSTCVSGYTGGSTLSMVSGTGFIVEPYWDSFDILL